eukprot:ctg_129.g103
MAAPFPRSLAINERPPQYRPHRQPAGMGIAIVQCESLVAALLAAVGHGAEGRGGAVSRRAQQAPQEPLHPAARPIAHRVPHQIGVHGTGMHCNRANRWILPVALQREQHVGHLAVGVSGEPVVGVAAALVPVHIVDGIGAAHDVPVRTQYDHRFAHLSDEQPRQQVVSDLQRRQVHHAGVQHQEIDVGHPLSQFQRGRAHRRQRRQLARQWQEAAARPGAPQSLHRLLRLVLRATAHHDRGTGARQSQRRIVADAGVAAGHHRDGVGRTEWRRQRSRPVGAEQAVGEEHPDP